jgi:putative addiction module component (TIGR02574 family)
MLDAKRILEAALKLSPEEREQIVVELSASLNSNFASKEIEAAWLAELDRRWKVVEEGKAVLHNWSDVRDELLAELRARR